MRDYFPLSDIEVGEDGLTEVNDTTLDQNFWASTVEQIITTKPNDAVLEAYQEDMFD